MRALGIAAATLSLAAPALGAAPVRATLTTSTATPVVDQPWRYTVRVRSAAGKPLGARMKLQLLLGTTVVGCWKGGEMAQCFSQSAGEWIAFRGKRSGILRFPVQAVAVKLTFQATVRVGREVRKLRAPVTVKPAS